MTIKNGLPANHAGRYPVNSLTESPSQWAAGIIINVFNRNFISPGCGRVQIFGLREVEWYGFSACVERIGADF